MSYLEHKKHFSAAYKTGADIWTHPYSNRESLKLTEKLSPGAYITQTIDTLSLVEFTWGFAKSVIFAILVSWIACLRGFQTRGGAAAVGNAATSAVVSSLFLIILFDSIIAVIRGYWG